MIHVTPLKVILLPRIQSVFLLNGGRSSDMDPWAQKRASHEKFKVVPHKWYQPWCSEASDDQMNKQANHNKKIVHLIISGSHFIKTYTPTI